MRPLVVAPVKSFWRRWRLGWIACQPGFDILIIKLLAPQHAGKSLSLHVGRVSRKTGRNDSRIKLVGLLLALLENLLECFAKRQQRIWRAVAQTQLDTARLTRFQGQVVMGRHLRT